MVMVITGNITAAIAVITVTEPPANHRVALGLGLITGLVLLGLGVPRLIAALVAMPETAPALHQAVRWADDSGRSDELGRLSWQQGDRPAALAATEAGLRLSPVQPNGWNRLAVLRHAAGLPDSDVWAALRLSLLSAGIVPSLMGERLKLVLDVADGLSPADQALVRRQIRQTYVINPTILPDLIANPAHRPLVLAALAEIQPGEMAQFSRQHRRLP